MVLTRNRNQFAVLNSEDFGSLSFFIDLIGLHAYHVRYYKTTGFGLSFWVLFHSQRSR